jgi:hypothetical protein
MAVCIVQDWVEPETERSTTNYDAITERVRPHAEDAEGFVLHAAGWTGNGFRIIEIWETQEAFERFMQDVVMPAVAEVAGDAAKQPAVTAFELYNLVTA